MDIKLITTILIVLTMIDAVQGSLADGSCSFTSPQDLCGYTLPTRWRIHQGQYRFHQRVTLIKGGIGDNYFALFDSETPFEHLNRNSSIQNEPRNTTYDMTSPVLLAGNYRLSFWYTLPAYQSTLHLILASTSDSSETLVWSDHGKDDGWNQTSIDISSNDTFRVVFRGYRWAYGQFIGLDNIRLQARRVTVWRETHACYGADQRCSSYKIVCSPGQKIVLGEMKYGTKFTAPSCMFGVSDCSVQERTCCVYSSRDGFTDFSVENRTNLLENCAGKQACSGWAPRLVKSPYSSYILIKYACVEDQIETTSIEPTTVSHARPATQATNTLSQTTLLFSSADHSKFIKYSSSETPKHISNTEQRSSSYILYPSSTPPMLLTSSILSTPLLPSSFASTSFSHTVHQQDSLSSKRTVNPTEYLKATPSSVTPIYTSSVQAQSSSVSSQPSSSRPLVTTSSSYQKIYTNSVSHVTHRHTSSSQLQSSSVSFLPSSRRLPVMISSPNPAIYTNSQSQVTPYHIVSTQVQSSSFSFPPSSSRLSVVTSYPNLAIYTNSPSHSTQRQTSSVQVHSSSVSFPPSSRRLPVVTSKSYPTISTNSQSHVTSRHTSSTQAQSSSASLSPSSRRLPVMASSPNPTIYTNSQSKFTPKHTSSTQVKSSSVYFPTSSSRMPVATSSPNPTVYINSPSQTLSIQVQRNSAFLSSTQTKSSSVYFSPHRLDSSTQIEPTSASLPSSSIRPLVMSSRQQITTSFSLGSSSYTQSYFQRSTSKPYTEITTSPLSHKVPFSMLTQTSPLTMPMTSFYISSSPPLQTTDTHSYKLTQSLKSKSSTSSPTLSSDFVVSTSPVSPSTMGNPSSSPAVFIPDTTAYTHVQATSVEVISSTAFSHHTSAVNTGTVPLLEDVIHLGCTTSHWNITIDMAALRHIYPNANRDNIFFGDNSCKGTELGAYLVFQQGLRECLTSERVASDKLVYQNDLFYAIFDTDQPIIRQHAWTFSLECDIGRNEAISKHVHHDVESHHATVSTDYDVNLAFYSDPNFNNVISGPQLHAKIGDKIFVKVYTTTADWTIKMHVHTCFTKPDGSSSNQTSYYLIKDGCEMDRNTHIISQSTHETRFVFRDFEFPQNHEGLNIYCNATFCKSMDYSPKCLQICNPGQGS